MQAARRLDMPLESPENKVNKKTYLIATSDNNVTSATTVIKQSEGSYLHQRCKKQNNIGSTFPWCSYQIERNQGRFKIDKILASFRLNFA